jgi:DNA-binding response OmpR family regulator
MRILVVEDERRVSRFLKKGLQEEGFTVDLAEDGEEGIAAVQRASYDAIILDLMLPRRNGLQVLDHLRGTGLSTPVLILSARGEVEQRVEGLNRGADDYLAKPFAFSEVLARLRSLIRRGLPAADQGGLLRVADLVLNVAARTVTRGGTAIALTAREFQVLEYLMRNRGRVLSRVTLTEHVWESDFDSDTNIVDAVITRLRRKVDDGHPVRLIHTVRGFGYVVREERHDDAEPA